MDFKILKIYAGWFDIQFFEGLAIDNSDSMGCDAPRLLINGLNNLLKMDSENEWLLWQGEPGGYIITLSRSNNMLTVEIFQTRIYASDIEFYSGEELAQYVGKKIYSVSGDIKDIAGKFLSEFNKYSQGDMLQEYENNWPYGFPAKKLRELQSLIAGDYVPKNDTVSQSEIDNPTFMDLAGISREIYDEIEYFCIIGEKYTRKRRCSHDAIYYYDRALELVPEPKERYKVATLIFTAIGENYYFWDMDEALNSFKEAYNSVGGQDNPLILLRLGQCYYNLDNMSEAREFLLRAYNMGGEKIFWDEEEFFLELIEDLIDGEINTNHK